MRYSFRLAELLGHVPDPRKRPGTIKAVVQYTGLDRHQVASLLKNEVKYIPMDALSRLCDYLVEFGYVSADELPGALFAVEPEHFWELLARRRRLEMCLGVRAPQGGEWPEGAWVVASDSVLLGELLNGVSTLGGTAKYVTAGAAGTGGGGAAGAAGAAGTANQCHAYPHPEHLKQSLVWSPGHVAPHEV
ncbi:MAG: helix-turn-helix transcriptional regulator, partial [Planctomycetes bacterium]|nr:helix-turn-helix transcriptional regulator [Planctomycetota bacterium]